MDILWAHLSHEVAMHFLKIFIILTSLSVLCGCGEKLDTTDPEGTYNLYRNALFEGNAEKVYDLLAPDSIQYFEDEFLRLQRMDKTIARYLPITDHKLARRQAGSILTDEITDGKSLFLKVFQPASMKLSKSSRWNQSPFEVGAIVEEIQVSEDGKAAKLTTKAKEEYRFQKNEKEQWELQLVQSAQAFQSAMEWMKQNENALQQTIDDLIEEETTKRESIIADLMGL